MEPFPNDKFILDAWMDTLATMDVCINEATPIALCDEKGFDLVLFQMVLVIWDPSTHINLKEDVTSTSIKESEAMYARNEISIHNEGKVEEMVENSYDMEDPNRELLYNASDELDE